MSNELSDRTKRRLDRILVQSKKLALLKPYEASVSTGSKEGFTKRRIRAKSSGASAYRNPMTWHGKIS